MAEYLPPILDLIPIEKIPADFGFIKDGINNVFSKLYFKNLDVKNKSDNGESWFGLTLVSKTKISFELPGTNGLELILNPGFITGGSTAFPISIGYQWGILKFINEFKLSEFDFSPSSFMNILLIITGVSELEILKASIEVFIDKEDEDPIQKFINQFNSKNNPPTPLIKIFDLNEDIIYQDLLFQLKNNLNNFDLIEIIFNDYINVVSDVDSIFRNIENLFSNFLGNFTIENVKEIIIPQVFASIKDLSVAISFPRFVLQPLLANNKIDPDLNNKSLLTFNIGSINYTSQLGLEFENESSLNFTKSSLLNTGLTIQFQKMKLDFSKKNNIIEAEVDGRPLDFIGVYIQEATIGFPTSWNHDAAASTSEIKGKNLLIGTGGLSGIITLNNANAINGKSLYKLGDTSNSGKYFELGIDKFLIEFKQNAIVRSEIGGTLKIPGFKDPNGNIAEIIVTAFIGTNGDFLLTAAEKDGLLHLAIPEVLKLELQKVGVGRVNDRWFLEASGKLTILVEIPKDSGKKLIEEPIDIRKIKIYDDGSLEFDGGGIKLPKNVNLDFGPISINVDHLSFGSDTGYHLGVKRQYFFFGFNGSLNTGNGSVSVRGDGVEFHFTRDSGVLHTYLRVKGIGIDLKFPGNAKPEDANILISGYLAMRSGTDSNGIAIPNSDVYAGGVALGIKMGGATIAGKAEMILNPSTQSWIVNAELDLGTPIPLAATGLGIYGFRGLVGKNYVASKTFIGLNENDRWYDYLKKKVPLRNKQGIGVEKFDNTKQGISVGFGACRVHHTQKHLLARIV